MMFAVTAAWMMVTAGFAQAARGGDAILMDFSSAHCAPCQAMKPILAQIERSGIPIRHVDVVAEPYLAARYGIRTTPTFVVLSGGKEVTRLVGTQSLQSLRAALAIDPSGPLIPTGSKSVSPSQLDRSAVAPQTRLAPIGGGAAPEPDVRAGQTLVAMNTAAPRSEPMPSVSLADAVERARAATVRLRVHDGHGYGAGTGTIIDTHGDEALVMTCGHLFRENGGKGKIEVDLYVGGEVRTVGGQVVDYDADTRDVALVAIRPGFPVQPVELIASEKQVSNGQTVFSFGCDRGDDPSRRDTRITGINKYNQHLGVSNLEIAGAPIDGRSGGGLFDELGRLIGVCNAADYKGDVGIYAGPGSIQWQLDRVGLTHLYEKAGASPPAGERIASLAGTPAAAGASDAPSVGNFAAVGSSAADQLTSAAGAPGIVPATATAGGQQLGGGQEVIVIVRDPRNPAATSQVMTLHRPSAELLQLIRQQAGN
jgi:thiol-disulfide isomerase/thioredoxin